MVAMAMTGRYINPGFIIIGLSHSSLPSCVVCFVGGAGLASQEGAETLEQTVVERCVVNKDGGW